MTEIIDDPKTVNDNSVVARRKRLPWTLRYPWVWLGLVPLSGVPVTILNGFCLGLWLRKERQFALSLILYAGLIGLSAGMTFFPASPAEKGAAVSLCLMALWFISAFRLRAEVLAYYSKRDGAHLYLRPSFTALLSASYINFVVARYEHSLERGEPVAA